MNRNNDYKMHVVITQNDLLKEQLSQQHIR